MDGWESQIEFQPQRPSVINVYNYRKDVVKVGKKALFSADE